MTTVGAIQSSYLPWKGYFDIINDVDIFVFYDDVKYTKNDWRNRNQLKDASGLFWITIPVAKDSTNLLLKNVKPLDHRWQVKHWKSIEAAYAAAPYFESYRDFFHDFYMGHEWDNLSRLNRYLTKGISNMLGISTRFEDSSGFEIQGAKTDLLINLLTMLKADRYVSGPTAKNYVIEERFQQADIKLEYKDYTGYPTYRQLWGGFSHQVSIVDVLMNCGPTAPHHIWGWRSAGSCGTSR